MATSLKSIGLIFRNLRIRNSVSPISAVPILEHRFIILTVREGIVNVAVTIAHSSSAQ
jgi:hypothetical protein